MRCFVYTELENRTWDNEVIHALSLIHAYKGKQSIYMKEKAGELRLTR